MAITDDLNLPSEEELKHKEIPLTHNYLLASSMWLGMFCDNECKEFMLCRTEERDPRKCLKYGHEVTDCGLKFFRKVKKACPNELEWYTKCIDFSGPQARPLRCRNEQAMFDTCMYGHGFERAKFGHFNTLRVHDTDRPLPKKLVPVFPDAVDHFDATNPEHQKPSPHGSGYRSARSTWFEP